MPTSMRNHDEATPAMPIGVHAVAPMLAIARQTHAALADATLGNISEALSTAQHAVESARMATNKVVEREARASGSASGFDAAVNSLAERNRRIMSDLAALSQTRTQAYVQLPERLAACRTPQDLVSLQMNFWQKVLSDYTDASRGLTAVWAGGNALPPRAGVAPSSTDEQPPDRADRASSLREASQSVLAASEAHKDGQRGPDGRRAA